MRSTLSHKSESSVKRSTSVNMTVAELDALCAAAVAALNEDIEEYDRLAEAKDEANQALDGHLTTSERARLALRRAERFPGEHCVAAAWLLEHESETAFEEGEE